MTRPRAVRDPIYLDDDEISLLVLASVLLRWRRTIVVLGLFGAMAGLASAAAAFRLMPSVNRALCSVLFVRSNLPVINTLHDEIQLAVPDRVKSAGPTPAFQSEIQLVNVRYTYASAPTPALNGLGLAIQTERISGLHRAQRVGKEHPRRRSPRTARPRESGQVVVDGQDIQPTLRAWQDQIGCVPQLIYLTDDALRRNVAFGLSSDEIDDALVHDDRRDR